MSGQFVYRQKKYNMDWSILINYRAIEDSSIEEINVWDDWRYELSLVDILRKIEEIYDIYIKDVYSVHFLTSSRILNISLYIEGGDNLILYVGNEGERLCMFSIYEVDNRVINLRKISNLLDKKYLIRDIKLSRLL